MCSLPLTTLKTKKKMANFPKALLLALFLSSCQTACFDEPEMIPVPCEWHSPLSQGMDESPVDNFIWWNSFQDPLLDSLMERAACQNLDLVIAYLRILEVRREEKGTIPYPRLDASLAGGHLGFNKELLNHLFKETHARKGSIDFFEIGFDAEWEIDLFGIKEHEMKAIHAKLESLEEGHSALWVSLSSEVAKNYIQLRGEQNHLKLIEMNIQLEQESHYLVEGLSFAGMADSINEWEAQEKVSLLKAREEELKLSIDKTIFRLSILLGESPGELFDELCERGALPLLPCNKQIGVPSELLCRRPDIRQKERELAQASEEIAVAVVSRFPRLSLTGFLGEICALSSSSFTWFLAPNILLPIFNSRLITQDVELNQIKASAALIEYRKTVLNALEETETAIASFHYDLEKKAHLAKAKEASQEVYYLTSSLYDQGFKSYLDLLIAHRSLLEREESLIDSEIELLLDYIALYKALGGAWDCRKPVPVPDFNKQS